jgi:hypothetical protein
MKGQRGPAIMEKTGNRRQRQQQTGSRYPISGPAAGLFPETFRQFLPAEFTVLQALFRKGFRPVEPSPPGQKFIGFFL